MSSERCTWTGDLALADVLRVDNHLMSGGVSDVRDHLSESEIRAAKRSLRRFGLDQLADLLERIGPVDTDADAEIEREWYTNEHLVPESFERYFEEHRNEFEPA